MNYFNFNGKIYSKDSLIIGPDNRGIRYGDGLFETIKYKDGHIYFEEMHFKRLWKGMLLLQFDIPKYFTPLILSEQIQELIKKNNFKNNVRIRLQVFRGDGGLYDPENNFPNYFIQAWQLPDYQNNWNENGLVIGIFKKSRKICDPISNIKHTNYLPYLLAAIEAKKQQWNDAILINEKYRICDTTTANIFIVKDKVIKTPSLEEGCIEGIMRQYIIEQLSKKSWEVEEKEITEEELKSADEVFISNSIYNIRWVKQINEIQYQNKVFQQIHTQLF